jgi:ribosomal protein S6--L-glutamate ligase
LVLAKQKKAAESVINAQKFNAKHISTEFIKANGKDLRLFVIDGKVVATIQREAMPGEFRANIHLGGTASVIKATKRKTYCYQSGKSYGFKGWC